MADAEGEDKAIKVNSPPAIYGLKEFLDGGCTPALAVLQLFERYLVALFQHENIVGPCKELILIEGGDLLFTEPFNIKRIARYEMAQPLHRLDGTVQPARAAHYCVELSRLGVRLARGMAAAFGAGVRKNKWLFASGLLLYHAHNLRNDVTRPLHNNCVAGANAQPFNFIRIVQGCIGDDHAAHCYGFEPRNRRHRAGTAHLYLDPLQ